MDTIQVVLDSKLLRATNGAAKRVRMNRSALIREAIREHLKRLQTRELEERERRGYERFPDNSEMVAEWEGEVSWPQDQNEARFASIISARRIRPDPS